MKRRWSGEEHCWQRAWLSKGRFSKAAEYRSRLNSLEVWPCPAGASAMMRGSSELPQASLSFMVSSTECHIRKGNEILRSNPDKLPQQWLLGSTNHCHQGWPRFSPHCYHCPCWNILHSSSTYQFLFITEDSVQVWLLWAANPHWSLPLWNISDLQRPYPNHGLLCIRNGTYI